MMYDNKRKVIKKVKYMDRYQRSEILIGEDNINKLWNSHVMVFGAGGVGSHCIEALARGGVGKITVIDSDCVAKSNINRQAVAYEETVGKLKTDVMEKIIHAVNKDITVVKKNVFVLPDNLDVIFDEKPDYIVDAIDTVTAKLGLAVYAKENDIPLISCMGTGNKVHPEMFEITDIQKTSVCPLCKVMRKELKARGVYKLKVLYSKEKPLKPLVNLADTEGGRRSIPGSLSFVPPVAGIMIAGEVIRNLIGWED